jgi:flagellar biosynthetic protein FliR
MGAVWAVGAAIAVLTGVVMGSVLAFAFAALTTAGQLITSLLGIELAGPSPTGIIGASSGFSSWWSWLGLVAFLQMGGFELLIAALHASTIALPLTHWGIPQDAWTYLIGLFSTLLATAVLLALPVVGVVLAIILVLALISRAYPQLQIYFLSSPVMILASLLVLWVMTPWMEPLLQNLWQATWSQLSHVLALWQAHS